MIELSTLALSKKVRKIYIFLPGYGETYAHIYNLFKENINIDVLKISEKDNIFFKLGLLSSIIKNVINLSDIIFIHNASLGKSCKVFFNHKPVILFFHTDKIKQIKLMRYINRVFTVNTTTSKYINKYFGYKKASFLPNCIDVDNIKIVPREFENYEKFKVGSMGRMVEKKGFETLINIFKQLPEMQLILAGDGPLMKKFRKSTKQYNNIKLMGWIEDKEDFFEQIDIFCLSSEIEPFGIVILEAMARGVPVISTNCNGPNDIIKNGYNGILVEKENLAELKYMFKKIHKNKTLLKNISNNGISNVKSKYTFEVYKKNLFKLLNDIKI